MSKKIIFSWKNLKPKSADRWNHNDIALFSLRAGYKSRADKLVSNAMEETINTDKTKLNNYIHSFVSLYKYAIEIILKQIYLKFNSNLPCDYANLVHIWDSIEDNITKTLVNPNFIRMIQNNKTSFVLYSFDNLNYKNIGCVIKELQYQEQRLRIWRNLMVGDGYYYMDNIVIDYEMLSRNVGEIYDDLEFILFMVDEYWI